ncbi:MAG: MerR family transcriptional regulator [Oscillospiraceae bacterium]|jgi:DNA-binding transcriptional MerR regulator|nr:MerR family transcriptional regulator [Oscillospiraceae bacterium]
MNPIKITDLVNQLGLSSRSLRYYEQVGLIKSVRPQFEKYRFYDEQAIERLKQIIVLRKMQIPVKDILRIYENEDMTTVVAVFVKRINELDEQVGALSEMKRIVGEFLKAMTAQGITKISALPLLYEEMDKELTILEEQKPATFEDLNAAAEKLAKPVDFSIVDLPPMRVLTSFLKPDTKESDFSGFLRYIQLSGLSQATGGNHRQFEFQTEAGEVLMVQVPDDFVNDCVYLDYPFAGGLFAATNVYLDEDLGQTFRVVVRQLDDNPYYQFAYCTDGTSRHPTLLENLISPDDKRELVAMYVPVKKRLANPALFDKPQEVTGITVAEIEAAEQVLWERDVDLAKLVRDNHSLQRLLDTGEIEYTGGHTSRVLNTGVEVKPPFRVDIAYYVDTESMRYYYGNTEGCIFIKCGLDVFGVNMNNRPDNQEQSLTFTQPIYHDAFRYLNRGAIQANQYNRVSWIVGAKHVAVTINGEVRYCGKDFPYMQSDFSHEAPHPIIVASDGQGKKLIRTIRITQLVQPPKKKKKKEELMMHTKQSNNTIPILHRLITGEYGENYWFNGCARYVMECLGEAQYDYQFFAGLTGDVIAQFYPTDGRYRGDGISGISMFHGDEKWVRDLFAKCGYAASFVTYRQLVDNKELYRQALIGYIDKGIPVIRWKSEYLGDGVLVGYEDHGKTLLFITGDEAQPKRLTFEEAITPADDDANDGWIFIGDKTKQVNIADVYRNVIGSLPAWFESNVHEYILGARAFRAWADAIEGGAFDDVKPEGFDAWDIHTAYVCALSTNASCSWGFFDKAMTACSEMTFLEAVKTQYQRMAAMWNNDNGTDLEALGGGFNVTLEALQDKEKRANIAAKLREFAACADEVVRIISENTQGGTF